MNESGFRASTNVFLDWACLLATARSYWIWGTPPPPPPPAPASNLSSFPYTREALSQGFREAWSGFLGGRGDEA